MTVAAENDQHTSWAFLVPPAVSAICGAESAMALRARLGSLASVVCLSDLAASALGPATFRRRSSAALARKGRV
ncbi:hypothetical protein MBEHAL_2069 [Halarchaeum acidiphilum MH1-52-1]|uniref:Uncharacterized protein n=1 Tax=Halarchaeum acidiphilum MH1-52-1 TaxID=1261545 RepID=U3A6P7_9EURY|nr:hypothetical protein MBEHAL_2069 [Halarchaeum acidiphilum MH1-52-1]